MVDCVLVSTIASLHSLPLFFDEIYLIILTVTFVHGV